MALPTITLSDMIARSRGAWRTQFPGRPIGVKQFLGQTARAVAAQVWSLQKSVEDVDLDIVPQPQSSTTGLQTWAFVAGLPNGAGGYGPLVPTAASGGVATLTGAAGTVYPGNAQAVAEDGTTIIALSGGVTLPGSSGSSSASGTFVAVTTGTVGDLPAGTRCTWVSPPAGADPVFTLTAGLSGANDTETNAQVYGRLVPRFQNPPNGGTTSDILKWAKTVAGVAGVYCFPRRSGTGTVDVVITLSGSGQARVAGATTIAAVQAAFDANRVPGSEAITALAPFAPNSRGHLVQVRVVPNGTTNAFDWGADSPGTAYVVDAYTAGTPSSIRLTGLAPTSLKNAISAYIAGTGPQPRLQVLSTGASPVNIAVGTSKTVTWSDGGGKTTITLDALPAGWVAPTAGDTVYPYGPVVSQIANGLLAFVDGLGPSRASGYGDTILPWADTLFLNQLTRVAEDAVDANGNALITEVIAGGTLIDGAALDVQGADTGNNPPELLYASHIAVTQ